LGFEIDRYTDLDFIYSKREKEEYGQECIRYKYNSRIRSKIKKDILVNSFEKINEVIAFDFVFNSLKQEIKSLLLSTTLNRLINCSNELKKQYQKEGRLLIIKYLLEPVFKIPVMNYSSLNIVENAKINLTILNHIEYFARRLIINIKL
jgi:hypothetical protein